MLQISNEMERLKDKGLPKFEKVIKNLDARLSNYFVDTIHCKNEQKVLEKDWLKKFYLQVFECINPENEKSLCEAKNCLIYSTFQDDSNYFAYLAEKSKISDGNNNNSSEIDSHNFDQH